MGIRTDGDTEQKQYFVLSAFCPYELPHNLMPADDQECIHLNGLQTGRGFVSSCPVPFSRLSNPSS